MAKEKDPLTGSYVGSGNTAAEPAHSPYYYDYTRNDPLAENPFTDAFDYLMAESVTGKTPYIYESPDNGKTIYRYERGTDPLKRELYVPEDDSPSEFTTLSDNDDQIAHHINRVESHLNYDELTLNIEDPTEEIMTDSRNKYLSLIHISEPTRPY